MLENISHTLDYLDEPFADSSALAVDIAYTDRLLKCKADKTTFDERKSQCIGKDFTDMNDVLCADMHLVLQGDMLTKVDMMSMANSFEVRVPFLDHTVVDYVSCLPSSYKIDSQSRKKILRETFADFFPSELLNRRKHGFEVPLLKWFNNELYGLIENDLLSEKFVEGQGLFNYNEVAELKNRLRGNNVGDAAAKVWALIVFQWWWKKTFA